MRRSTTAWLALACVVTLAAPTVVAEWYAFGSFEPDTSYDKTGGFMFTEPNTAWTEKAYLSVVAVSGDVYSVGSGAWANPNVGALHTRIYPAGPMQFDAMFGSWIDCNLDGYIGHAESVLIEYPTTLLPANSPCPPGVMGKDNMYNQQGWVSELRWISNDNLGRATGDSGDNRDKRVLVDNNATIWGDFGVPGDTMGREICPRDFPPGTTRTTGGILNWADCFAAHRLWSTSNTALTPFGMGFQNQDDFNEEGHALNQETFGRGHKEDTYATVWDCDAPRNKINTGQKDVGTKPHNVSAAPVLPDTYTLPWFDFTDSEGNVNFTIWNGGTGDGKTWTSKPLVLFGIAFDHIAPQTPRSVDSSPSVNPNGNVAGTWNHTYYLPHWSGDCEQSDTEFYAYLLESDTIGESSSAKNRVTIQFQYYEEQRNGVNARGMAWYGTQVYPGLRQLNTNGGGTHWYATYAPSELGSSGPTPPQLIRSSDLQPEGAIYWTFYANLSAQGLNSGIAVPGAAEYGAEWCSKSLDPAFNGGFVCDGDQWYVAPDGKYVGGQTVGGFEYAPKPGTIYHLRDVDCYDGTVAAGVKASLADVSSSGGC